MPPPKYATELTGHALVLSLTTGLSDFTEPAGSVQVYWAKLIAQLLPLMAPRGLTAPCLSCGAGWAWPTWPTPTTTPLVIPHTQEIGK